MDTAQQPAAGVGIATLRRLWDTSLAFRSGALAVGYVIGALLGLSLAIGNPHVSAVWPPTGIAVAAIVVYGPRMWVGIAVGAFVSNVVTGASVETSAAIAIGNTLAPVTAGWLLRRTGFRPAMTRLKDVATLVFVAALGCMLISSIPGTIALGVGGLIEPGHGFQIWFEWWVGDATGVSVVAPLLLTLASKDRDLIRRHRAEAVVLFGLTILVSMIAFASVVPIKYLVFPLAIWAALRFHQLGSSILTFLIAAVAIWARARGKGPFADLPLIASVFSIQGFNAAVSLTSLSLSAVMTERTKAQEDLRGLATELEARVEERTEELAESERRMREAQALAHIGSFHWDMRADKVTWTDEMYRIYGLDPERFPATFEAYLASVHPEDRDRVRKKIESAIHIQSSYDHEYRIVRPDGKVLWVHGRGETVLDEAGRMVGLTGFCHDITERKRVEDSLRAAFEGEREAAKRLREVDDMKNSLLAAVSHELRTPLTVIIGVSDTLARPEIELDSDDTRYLLGRLGVHAQRLHRLLMDLLDLDRLNRGIIEARLRPTELRELVLRVLEALEINDHPISIEMEPITLSVDGAHVERIIENLLINAGKHTPPGTRIWVRTERAPGGFILAVEDNGPGVACDLRDAIFEPFRQGDTPEHAPGTGIGLSLVARFARLNGGHAWVEDRAGGGSSFRVLFPATSEAELTTGAA
ncbi:MAG: MASE1 domain-containing protein [Actinomycetota bacterium]